MLGSYSMLRPAKKSHSKLHIWHWDNDPVSTLECVLCSVVTRPLVLVCEGVSPKGEETIILPAHS